jgi:hemerythrin superfamily protein
MTTVGQKLHDDHQALEGDFEDLLNRVHVDDTCIIEECWDRFEKRLRDHMRFEEEKLLPAYARERPEIAMWIREDHEKIEQALDEIGLEIQLHQLREEKARAFVALLREHAAREARSIYGWTGATAEIDDEHWHPTSSGPSIA